MLSIDRIRSAGLFNACVVILALLSSLIVGASFREYASREELLFGVESMVNLRREANRTSIAVRRWSDAPSLAERQRALREMRRSSVSIENVMRRFMNESQRNRMYVRSTGVRSSSAQALAHAKQVQTLTQALLTSPPRTSTRERLTAHAVAAEANSLAAAVDRFYLSHERDHTDHLAQQKLLLAALGLGLLIAILFQSLVVVRSLLQRYQREHDEILAKKQTLEAALADLTERSNELQYTQHELHERLSDNQVMSENFRVATHRLQKVLSSLPVPCIGTDLDLNVYEWNEAAQRQFGYSLFDLFERPLPEFVVGEADREILCRQAWECRTQDRPISFELPSAHSDGTRLLIEWNMTPMRGANGEISSFVITCTDVTARALQEENLKEMAYKDALTGLNNRRAFLQCLQDELDGASLSHSVSVIMMDVDKFKVYNDSFGHPAGDTLLRRVGDVLKDHMSPEVIAGRYGGEEFILLVKGPLDRALTIAETLREAIAERTLDLNGGATASFGVHVASPGTSEPGALIQAADLALYHSKNAGRNRVTAYDHIDTEPDQGTAQAA